MKRIATLEADRKPVDPTPTDWAGVKKQCERCGKTKLIIPDFGVTFSKKVGKAHPQGWCRACRNEASRGYQAKRRAKLKEKKS